MEKKLDFSNLVPRFLEYFNGEILLTSAAGFSTTIVLFLILFMTGCLIFAVIKFRKGKHQVRFYQETLSKYQPDQVFAKREEINEKIAAQNGYFNLWQEFDESLVCVKENLYNTLDASHFFNHYSLARGLTDNRFLAAVPGFLTAIGVIGTFAGLQIGLGEIQDAGFGKAEAGVTEIKRGIDGMIGGASIAFMTSVWGIGTSVFFNIWEKVLERSIRSSISQLQNQIDYLYQRLTAEKSLSDIEGHSRESREIMQTLAEKIGDRMQEALIETTDKIKDSLVDSLQSILGPNIEKLVDNANSGSEVALNSLVERFMDAMTSEGKHQSAQMESASAGVQQAVNNMQSGLNTFVSRLDEQIGVIAERSSSIISNVQDELNEQIQAHQKSADRRDQAFQSRVQGLQQSQNSLDQLILTQKTQQDDMLSQIRSVTGDVESMAKHNQAIGEQLRETAEAYLKQINSLHQLSQSLQSASQVLGTDIRNATQSAQTLIQQNERIGDRTEKVLNEMNGLLDSLLAATRTLDKTAAKSTEGLEHVEQYFRTLADQLKKHSEDFGEQVNKLLSDYRDHVSGQTNERLNQWNVQTQNYTTAMTNAIEALSQIVDEIEGKLADR